jgi:hypothetical protein
MVIAPLTMTSEREEVIDFVAPYFDQSGISIGRYAVHHRQVGVSYLFCITYLCQYFLSNSPYSLNQMYTYNDSSSFQVLISYIKFNDMFIFIVH